MKIIHYLIFIYLFLFSFGQFLRIPPQSKSYNEIHLYLTDIIVGLLVVVFYLFRRYQKKKILDFGLSKPLLFFVSIASIALVLSPLNLGWQERIVASLYLIRWFFYAGLFFVIANQENNFKEKLVSILPKIGLLCAFLGLIQYLFFPDTRILSEYGWDPHYYRLIGTFLDPGFLGLILVFSLILLTSDLFRKKDKVKQLFWAVIYIALALTYSRASYLAYFIAMFSFFLFYRAKKFFVFVIVLGVLTLFLLPRLGGESTKLSRESTIRYRITSWQHAVIVFAEHPLLGIGFNAYRYAQRQYGFMNDNVWEVSHGAPGADSSLLFILATTGILGLFSTFYLYFKLFSLTHRNLLITASVLAILVHSWFQNSLFYPWIMGWLWMLWGSQVREQT